MELNFDYIIFEPLISYYLLETTDTLSKLRNLSDVIFCLKHSSIQTLKFCICIISKRNMCRQFWLARNI